MKTHAPSPVRELIAALGRQADFARALRLRDSTVSHWVRVGRIPSYRAHQIERAFRRRRVAIPDAAWRALFPDYEDCTADAAESQLPERVIAAAASEQGQP
jgi:DNA-binding transcriptional regulator YdaS (Cro superfamily)